MNANIGTPCIGVCSTVYGDDVCRGCKRHFQEVIDWNQMSSAEKNHTYERINKQAHTVVRRYVRIVDEALLLQNIQRFNIAAQPEHNIYYAFLMLLRSAAETIQDIEQYGIVVNKAYKTIHLAQLYKQMDQALFHHASIHSNIETAVIKD